MDRTPVYLLLYNKGMRSIILLFVLFTACETTDNIPEKDRIDFHNSDLDESINEALTRKEFLTHIPPGCDTLFAFKILNANKLSYSFVRDMDPHRDSDVEKNPAFVKLKSVDVIYSSYKKERFFSLTRWFIEIVFVENKLADITVNIDHGTMP